MPVQQMKKLGLNEHESRSPSESVAQPVHESGMFTAAHKFLITLSAEERHGEVEDKACCSAIGDGAVAEI